MKKVKYGGLRPKGTLTPRRMWRPGEVLVVDDTVAEELAEDPDFRLIGRPRTRRRRERR